MKDMILEALGFIEVSKTTYDEWLRVGLALKAEGYEWSVWDNWSKNDSRYKLGECERKWRSFTGSSTPLTGATIVQMAKNIGYIPHNFKGDGCLDWDSVIEYDGDGVVYEMPVVENPVNQLITYLKTLYKDDELVSYCTNDVWQDKEGKWMPSKGVSDRTAKELINSLEKHPDDI